MPGTSAPQRTALVKEAIWPKIGYVPHRGQRLIHASSARHRAASCGRRFGKSKAGGSELVPDALLAYTQLRRLEDMGLQQREWIVGPNYDDCEREFRVFYDACKRLQFPMDHPGTYNSVEGGNMSVSLWQGRFQVECRSAAHPESLDGEGLSHVLMAEAAKMKASIWHKYIRPALSDRRGTSLWNTTPEGKNWFYEDIWKAGQPGGDPDYRSWRMPSWINDAVYPGGEEDPEILAMKRDMSAELFAQEIGASFTDFVGRVFKDFDEQIHVQPCAYDPAMPLYLASDYGWSNPTVILFIQVDIWDNVYVIDEWRGVQKDMNEVVAALKEFRGGLALKAVKLYPEPASPGDTKILASGLKVPVAPNTGGELKHRLELIRRGLKLQPDHVPWEERKPTLYFSPLCNGGPDMPGKGLIFEMDEYRYPERKKEEKAAPEQPMDKDDHGPEALGRFYRGHFGLPLVDKKSNRAKQGRVRVSR